jgi:hypothetical protein
MNNKPNLDFSIVATFYRKNNKETLVNANVYLIPNKELDIWKVLNDYNCNTLDEYNTIVLSKYISFFQLQDMQDIEINIFSKDFIFNKEREYFNDRLLSVSDNTNLENEFDEFDIYDNIRLNYIIRYFNSEDIGNKDLFLSDYGLINNEYNNIYIFRNITLDEFKN